MGRDRLRRRISQLAELCVMKAAGYACLGIVVAMSGMAFAPSLATRWGAVMMLILAAALEISGRRYHRVRRINETEVWNLLKPDERPDHDLGRALIVPAMRAQLHQKSLLAAWIALVLLAASVFLRVSGYQ